MNMVRQAQKMQQEFLKMQQELESTEFSFSAGGGAVKATIMGTREFRSIEIDPEVVDPDDVEMLQDLILTARTTAPARPWPSCRAVWAAACPACSERIFNWKKEDSPGGRRSRGCK